MKKRKMGARRRNRAAYPAIDHGDGSTITGLAPENPPTPESPTCFMPEDSQDTPNSKDLTEIEIGRDSTTSHSNTSPTSEVTEEESVFVAKHESKAVETSGKTLENPTPDVQVEDDVADEGDGFDVSPVVSEDPRYTGVAAELREALPYAPQIFDLIGRLISNCGIDVRRFMEIGCGDAILAEIVLKAFPTSNGVLLDVDEPSLSTAWERLGEGNKRMAFVSQDVSAADWAESVTGIAPFDLIIAAFVIDQQSDEHKVDVYADIYDLLGPGGVFLNLDYVSIAAPFARSVHDMLMIDSLAAKRRESGIGDPQASAADYANRPDKPFLMPSQTDVQCEWLREIGFVGVDCFFRGLGVALFGGAKPLKPSVGTAD